MSFWSGKRVFITGHTGFKGSWLCLWLQSLGAKVTGYALEPPSQPNLFTAARVGDEMENVTADIRDQERVERAVRTAKPEVLIHMAAQPLVRQSYHDPAQTYATNIMGTVHVLEAVRQVRTVRAAIIVTSDKCYENREWVWPYREHDRLGGRDPYSNSKACAELVTAAYRESFFPATKYEEHGVALASVRAGNVIGGGDWAQDRLVPDLIRAFSVHKAALIRNPGAIRPWQHVLEPLSGYLRLAEALLEHGMQFAEAWNFGPTAADFAHVGHIADTAARLWGASASWIQDGAEAPHEANILKLDSAKAHSRLKWKPKWNLDSALEQTISWYKEHDTGVEMRDRTLSQISAYEDKAVAVNA